MLNPINQLRSQRNTTRRAQAYRDLIRKEAKIGGQLFGPIQPEGRREFFCLDKHTWIWHEEWTDKNNGQRKVVTTRYDIRPSGILKAQDGQNYRYVDFQEAYNLYRAVQLYAQRINNELYGPVA